MLLDSELINELPYPDSKEYFSTLKSNLSIKTILKHVLISAVSLSSLIAFILALWQMHVFAFVWSGLKHCSDKKMNQAAPWSIILGLLGRWR